MNDGELLSRYCMVQDQRAFAELVRMHGDWVYSAARRQLGDEHLAEDATQAVFVLLARKADRLVGHPNLGGWLFSTLRYCVSHLKRQRAREARREQEAAIMRQEAMESSAEWAEIGPVVDAAVGELGTADRNALLLRFYQRMSLAEVGAGIGASEEAARKRVGRALERLRDLLARRGVTTSADALGVALAAELVHAVPERVVTGWLAQVAHSGITPTAKGALAAMRLAQVKMAAGILLVVGLAGAGVAGVGLAGSAGSRPVQQTGSGVVAPAPAPAQQAVAAMGTVVTMQGQAVAGATVRITPEDRSGPTRTIQADAKGRFALPEIDAGKMVRLEIQAAGFAARSDVTAMRNGDGKGYPEGLRFQVRRTASISGRVLDASGRPLPGAPVALASAVTYVGSSLFKASQDVTTTSADGRFTISNLVSGTHLLTCGIPAGAAGGPRCVVITVEIEDGQATAPVTMDLRNSTKVISGVVTGPDGSPIENVAISATLQYQKDGLTTTACQVPAFPPVRTDVDGRYRITGLHAGKWFLRPSHAQFARGGELQVVELAEEDAARSQDLRVLLCYDRTANGEEKMAQEAQRLDTLEVINFSYGGEIEPYQRPWTKDFVSFVSFQLGESNGSTWLNLREHEIEPGTPPEEVAAATHAGEAYLSGADTLVPVCGARFVPLELPEPPYPGASGLARAKRLKPSQVIEQARRYLAQATPEQLARVKIKEGEVYLVLRGDERGFLLAIGKVEPERIRTDWMYVGAMPKADPR